MQIQDQYLKFEQDIHAFQDICDNNENFSDLSEDSDSGRSESSSSQR